MRKHLIVNEFSFRIDGLPVQIFEEYFSDKHSVKNRLGKHNIEVKIDNCFF